MCDYQGYEFGARYPDSVCVDGRLLDADNCDRGHIRRLDETRVTWVNSCVVGNDVHGKVVKDYRYSQSDASEKP